MNHYVGTQSVGPYLVSVISGIIFCTARRRRVRILGGTGKSFFVVFLIGFRRMFTRVCTSYQVATVVG